MSVAQQLKAHADILRRAALLVLILVVVAVAVSVGPVHDSLVNAMNACREVIEDYPTAGAFLFVICAALSAMLAFVSVAVIVPVAVYTWGAPISLALLWLGWILGGAVSYAIGQKYGRPILGRLASKSRIRKFESRVRNDMPFLLVILFQLALPSEIPGYLLGAARYRFTKYLLALSIAELPYTVATIYLSEGILESRSATVVLIGVGLIALSGGAVYFLRSKP